MIASWDNGAALAVDRICLNGEVVHHVIRADDIEGEVTRNVVGEDGKLKVVGDEFATITETGVVTIELHYGWRYDTVHNRFILLPKSMLQ